MICKPSVHLRMVAIVLLCVLTGGCDDHNKAVDTEDPWTGTTQPTDTGVVTPDDPTGADVTPSYPDYQAPSPPDEIALPVRYTELARMHNRRVSRFRHLSSIGVVELRWLDEEGEEHFEPQVDLNLYLELPRETALSMKKLGQPVFWIGSDDDQFWLFDLHSKKTTAYIGRWDDLQRGRLEGIAALHPAVMLDLIGVSKIPEQPNRGGRLEVNDDGELIAVIQRPGATVRMTFDERRWLPTHVDLYDDLGDLRFTGDLGDYESVYVPGIAVMEYPKLPRAIDMASAEGDVKVKMRLDQPTCDPKGKPFDRVFDLEKLSAHLQPAEVRYLEQQ